MRVSRKSETSVTQDQYTALGFKPPAFIENPYGIKIYIGTKGKEDWTVVIPQWIMQREHNYNKDFAFYLVTEEHALSTAERATRWAQKYKGEF